MVTVFRQMVAEFATKTAYEPAMWGNATPDPASATQLASVLTQEWSKAVDQMLRHWSSPPTTDSFYWVIEALSFSHLLKYEKSKQSSRSISRGFVLFLYF